MRRFYINKRIKILACWGGVISASGLVLLAFSYNRIQNKYPDYEVIEKNIPEYARLHAYEKQWIKSQIDSKKIRAATEDDMKSWTLAAKNHQREVQYFLGDIGYNFVILDKLYIPAEIPNRGRLSNYILFLVPENVPIPKVKNNSPVYFIDTGGWYLDGFSDGLPLR